MPPAAGPHAPTHLGPKRGLNPGLLVGIVLDDCHRSSNQAWVAPALNLGVKAVQVHMRNHSSSRCMVHDETVWRRAEQPLSGALLLILIVCVELAKPMSGSQIRNPYECNCAHVALPHSMHSTARMHALRIDGRHAALQTVVV